MVAGKNVFFNYRGFGIESVAEQITKVIAEMNQIDVEYPTIEMGKTNKTDWYVQHVQPSGRVPGFLAADGEAVFEAAVIAEKLATLGNAAAMPKCPADQRRARSWIMYVETSLRASHPFRLYPVLIPQYAFNKTVADKFKTVVQKALETLETYLTNNSFLAGERVSFADLFVFAVLAFEGSTIMNEGFLYQGKKRTALKRWVNTIKALPAVKSVYGDFKFIKAPKKPINIEESAAAPVKSQEKKPKAQAKAAASAEVVESAPAKKPVIGPLPESDFNIITWKVLYSNTDDTPSIMPQFWEMFDSKTWSIFFSDYKYADEYSMAFIASNGVTGWHQRADLCRKRCFGVVLVLTDKDDKKKISVSGAWVVPGTDGALPQELLDVDDTELHTWARVDVTSAADRKKVEEIFCWDGDLDGRVCEDGKVLK